MKITVQMTVRADEGKAEVVQEVTCLECGSRRPETLGFTLAEARSILARLEQTMVARQVMGFVPQEKRCLRCRLERASKDCHPIVFRTPFGKPIPRTMWLVLFILSAVALVLMLLAYFIFLTLSDFQSFAK